MLSSPEHRRLQLSCSPGPGERTEANKLIIIAGRCGRLGNRITLFANFVAWAAEHGHRLINFTFHSYAHLFETTRRDVYCQYPVPAGASWLDRIPGLTPLLRKTRFCVHLTKAASVLNERRILLNRAAVTLRDAPGALVTPLESREFEEQISNARIIFINGWTFRAPHCVERQASIVRSYFRPIPECLQASQRAVARLRAHADLVVGVHIRQGDYRGWRHGKFFFPISRYVAWMRELAEQFPASRVAFLVCSDEPRSADEFPGLKVGFAPGVPAQDIYALAECDYIIGPVSSFSQWASFYGHKPVFHLTGLEARIDRAAFRVSFLGEVPN